MMVHTLTRRPRCPSSRSCRSSSISKRGAVAPEVLALGVVFITLAMLSDGTYAIVAGSVPLLAGRAQARARPDQRLQLRRVGRARRAVARLELERARVDAVTHPARVAGAVLEDVPEVPAAGAADDLRAVMTACGPRASRRCRRRRLGEARPARPGVELRVGGEQLGPAARAAVDAVLLDVPVPAREGALGPPLRRTSYCSGVSSSRHCWSVFWTCSVAMHYRV